MTKVGRVGRDRERETAREKERKRESGQRKTENR